MLHTAIHKHSKLYGPEVFNPVPGEHVYAPTMVMEPLASAMSSWVWTSQVYTQIGRAHV